MSSRQQFLSTTYLHVASITSLSWVYLRVAFHSKRLHAASYFRQEIWQCFSLQRTFTSPPSHNCPSLLTENAWALRLISAKRFGSVSLYTLPSHHLHHKFVLSLPPHCISQQTPSRCALICHEIRRCFSLQLTFTSPPPLACLEYTFALLLTASAFAPRLLSVKRCGIVYCYN